MRLVLQLSPTDDVVIALIAIALCAVLALERMPVDIFPKSATRQSTWRSPTAAWIPRRWKAT